MKNKMELKEKVCNSMLAEKIKKLRVKQDSLWYWQEIKGYSNLVPKGTRDFAITDPRQKLLKFYSAFTVAELGAMLPFDFKSGKVDIYDKKDSRKFGFACSYKGTSFVGPTEADTRAYMLIHLLEKKLKR